MSYYTVIRFSKPFYEELYDLQDDPYELRNMARTPSFKKNFEENRQTFVKIAEELRVACINENS
jgi:hypothetical protein